MTAAITCQQCGGVLGSGDHFCAQCGSELLWCASCGKFLLQAEQTCPGCGTPGMPRPRSTSVPYQFPEEPSPWVDVVARLRRATLGEFEIGHELGRGGMAAVFLAQELSLHRDVAIKVMSPGLPMREGMIERFRREAITIAHLNHPNIVPVYSVRAAEGLHFFVMRCIQGRSLEQIITDAGKLPVPIVRSILHQVGSALAYAHRFKVVHRDIKPANILIDEDGNAVVTDFGIAKAAEGPRNTNTGFMVGTPAYMSPEQCSGGQVSGASDQYSLGVAAYEMISGVAPFTGSTYTVIQAHVESPPAPLTDHCADCPPELEAAIMKMLAKNPEERWPSMGQAIAGLGAVSLSEDDPHRAELSRLASAGVRREEVPVEQRTPSQAITILLPPPGLEVGDTFLLVARVHDGEGARLPSRPVVWSSDTPSVLRVSPTRAVATAIAPGSAVILAVSEGKEGRLRITVAPTRADTIVVKSFEKPITTGDRVQLEATPRDKRGQILARTVSWRSEDDAIASLTPGGMLVARSSGSTTVTAELDDARAALPVTVLPTSVAAIHISPPPETVTAGDSFALTATPLDRWAGTLTGRTIAWSVSNVGIAIATATGWVMTRNPGTVVLTATCDDVAASITINVLARTHKAKIRPLSPESIVRPHRRSRSRPSWLVRIGASFLLVGGVWFISGRRWVDPGAETGAATRDSLIMAGGDSAIAVQDSSRKDSGSIPEPAPVGEPNRAARAIGPGSLSITSAGPVLAGDSVRLSLTARDRRGVPIRAPRVVWGSSDTAVAQIDAASGVIRAGSAGTALILARAGSDSAMFSLTVLPAAVGSIQIEGAQPLKVGDSLTLRAGLHDQVGRALDQRAVIWNSTETEVAEVDSASGVVLARSPGSTEITANAEGKSDRVRLTVLTPPLTGRTEPPAGQVGEAPPGPGAAPQERLMKQILAGVEQCYGALARKDVSQVQEFYNPLTHSDLEKLKKLSRILRTPEWAAQLSERQDHAAKIDGSTATAEFSFWLTWKDAFGGRLTSHPVFRAEFMASGGEMGLYSCRIVGSPKL